MFIEAGSAGSVESSLGNICGSREQMYQQDVENELIDAMADTSDNSSLLEGRLHLLYTYISASK